LCFSEAAGAKELTVAYNVVPPHIRATLFQCHGAAEWPSLYLPVIENQAQALFILAQCLGAADHQQASP